MSFEITNSIRVTGNKPDSERYIAPTVADRDQLVTDLRVHVGMQVYLLDDGGAVARLQVLSSLGPAVWEDIPVGTAAGPVGPVGPTGADSTVPGPDGPVGPTGADSVVAGPDGPVGPTGSQGDQGVTGAVGPVGSTGSIGPIGNDGPVGPTGSAGTNGWDGVFINTPISGAANQDGNISWRQDTLGNVFYTGYLRNTSGGSWTNNVSTGAMPIPGGSIINPYFPMTGIQGETSGGAPLTGATYVHTSYFFPSGSEMRIQINGLGDGVFINFFGSYPTVASFSNP